MKPKVFLDGDIVKVDQKQLEALTPGVLKAKGAFETMRFENGKILALDAHLKRLFKGLKFQNIQSPHSIKKLKDMILSFPQANSRRPARIRLVVWQEKSRVRTAIMSELVSAVPQMCRVIISKTIRGKSQLSHLKSLDYSCFRQAFLEAKRQGYDEAILLNREGKIVEGSRTNIFLVKDKILYTPSLKCGCLNGITRQMILRIAQQNNITCRMVEAIPKSLMNADEAFLTNSVLGVVPLTKVNDNVLNKGRMGQLTRFFRKAYENLH